MQRWYWLALWALLLGPAISAPGEPPSPGKQVDGKPVHPLTIRGQATDHEGKPVMGAKVFLISANRVGHRSVIAKTATNAEGRYVFHETPLPLDVYDSLYSPDAKVTAGAFQVFALADGYGLTWHPKLKFHVDPRPPEKGQKDQIYAGEEGRADFAFDLPARISGRVTNEQGQPLAGVKVQVGYCDDPRRPGGHGSWMCSYLGPQGDELQTEAGRFDGIQQVPEKFRAAITDEQGRYQFTQLRRDTLYSMLLDAAPECDPVQLSVATTNKEGAGRRALGYDGEVNETFKTPWQFVVQVVAADSQPQANVKIRALGTRILRAGGVATTDAAGQATLKLLAGKYTLFLEPPYGSPYVLTEREVTVSPESSAEINSLTLDAAATLLIQAVEEGTGKPVPGVSFVEEVDSGKRRQELQSQTVFVDHPVTDGRGELRAIVSPGERRLLVAKQPVGFEPVNKASELLKSPAKGSESVTFTFKKAAAATAATPFVPEDEGEIGKLNALILRQQELTKAGRFEVKSHLAPMKGFTGDDLLAVLAACNPQEIPDLPALLRKKNPAVEISFSSMVVVVDGGKSKNEIDTGFPQLGRRSRHVMAFNGVETTSYMSDSPQVDIYSQEKGGVSIAPTGSQGLMAWQPIPKIRQNPEDVAPERKITHEGGRIIVEFSRQWGTYQQAFDEKTGFLYHQTFLQNDRKTGNERWQFAPRLAPSGGIVPGLVVEAIYRRNQVGLLRIYEFNSVSLGPQPPDSFVVSVPAGTLILDHRGNQRTPKTAMAVEHITDAVARANQISDNSRSILNVLKDGDSAPIIEPAAWLNADGPTEWPDWKGKVLLVDFWGTGCGPCIAELPRVQEFAVKFQKAGGFVLGLHDSGAEPAEVTEFVRKRGLTYQFAIDKPDANTTSFGATFQAYGIRGIPNCAVIDRKGNVVYLGRFEEAARRATRLLEMETK